MSISQFRFNRRRKHPSYVFNEKDNKYQSLIITHSPVTRKKNNIRLYKNPNNNDSSTSYIVPKIVSDNKSSYNKPYKNWNFDKNDKRKIKRLIKRK